MRRDGSTRLTGVLGRNEIRCGSGLLGSLPGMREIRVRGDGTSGLRWSGYFISHQVLTAVAGKLTN